MSSPFENNELVRFSQSAENNKQPIADVLAQAFEDVREVLEIASGTGQHAVHVASRLTHLTWQPSDLTENLASLNARIDLEAPQNVRPPIELDIGTRPWPVESIDGVFSANSLHIISWPLVEDFFSGVGEVLAGGGRLCVYGPFKYNGAFTTPSNERFGGWLKGRDVASGIRDFEAVNELAAAQELDLVADHAMPANNQMLVWKKRR
jgi:SAM-dependent methyltransferase